MSLRCFSPKVHQYLVAGWQVFPVWIVILQYMFGRASGLLSSPREMNSKPGHLHAVDFESLDRLYRFAFALATLTHCINLELITVVQWFPGLVTTSNDHTVPFKEVFLPPITWTEDRVSNIVQGAHDCFQYDRYVGSTSAIMESVRSSRGRTDF